MNEIQGEEAYEQLQKLLKEKRDNFRVMEKQVDIDVQMAYFDAAKKIKKKLPEADTILKNAKKLYDPDVEIEEKKIVLNQLASLENVKSFREIEAFSEKAGDELDDWATMAYQESLMLMESAFSDEEKVFVSSGMGGKGNKLRYFATFLHSDLFEDFTDLQMNLIRKEVKYHFDKAGAEIEEESFKNHYFMITCLIPIDINITILFRDIVNEVNQFGFVLAENFLVTNVKKLSYKEVDDFVKDRMRKVQDEVLGDVFNNDDDDLNTDDDDNDEDDA
jgi:hypothetical protein